MSESGSPGQLAKPINEVHFNTSFANKPIPRWENGLLFAYEHDVMPPVVSAWGRDGQLVTRGRIVISDAIETRITGIAAFDDGRLAVSGFSFLTGGRPEAFLAFLNPAGRLERIVDTSPFGIRRLCTGSSGELWAFGVEKQPGMQQRKEPHDTLRRYSRDGVLTGSFLSTATFGSMTSHPSVYSFMAASRDRVGIYSGTAGEYIELGIAGQFLGRWKGVPLGQGQRVSGLAISRAGSVYVTTGTIGRDTTASAPLPGKLFRLERATGSWAIVEIPGVTDPAKPFVRVYGNDGDELVFSNRLPDLLWVKTE
jgi:hypothetical protein